MNQKKVKFRVKPIRLMKMLSSNLEHSKNIPDEEFWEDRIYFMKQNFDNDMDTYMSTDKHDKKRVIDYDIETINVLINQVLRFGRIVFSNDNGKVYNIPKDAVKILDIRCKNQLNSSNEFRTIPRMVYEPEIGDSDGK